MESRVAPNPKLLDPRPRTSVGTALEHSFNCPHAAKQSLRVVAKRPCRTEVARNPFDRSGAGAQTQQIQPQILTVLSLITWGQCFHYDDVRIFVLYGAWLILGRNGGV